MNPIPQDVLMAHKSQPMALIRFLRKKRAVLVPDRPEELIPTKTAVGLRMMKRGYGWDCGCEGSGRHFGLWECERHIPKEPYQYITLKEYKKIS